MIVLGPGEGVLLQHFRTPEGWEGWITPGGGVEPGETASDAAVRELAEEIGLRDVELHGPVWRRRHVFEFGGRLIDQREEFFLVRLDVRVNAAGESDPAVLASEGVVGHRWWDLPELEGADVVTAPRSLAGLLRRLLAEGAPREPFVVE